MNKTYLFGCMGILMMAATMSSCSNDDDPTPGQDTAYTWTTDGGLKACDHLLFGEDGKDNAEGKVIGNGDQELVFKGKQTLKKGVYTLKGWIYIGAGS